MRGDTSRLHLKCSLVYLIQTRKGCWPSHIWICARAHLHRDCLCPNRVAIHQNRSQRASDSLKGHFRFASNNRFKQQPLEREKETLCRKPIYPRTTLRQRKVVTLKETFKMRKEHWIVVKQPYFLYMTEENVASCTLPCIFALRAWKSYLPFK